MRERLIELIESARYWGSGTSAEIADHLLAEGVIVPKAKIGDTIYVINASLTRIHEHVVTRLEICEGGIKIFVRQRGCHQEHWACWDEELGDNDVVFLTREEAEQALAKMKGGAEK